jgi:putative membrane protein
MMVKDHTKASAELKSIANGKKLGLPVTLDKDTQDRVDSMSLQSSAGFDLKFMEIMVAVHKKDVAAFEHATTALADPDLKAFAVKTLPVLKMHLADAEKLNTAINKKNAANNGKK